MKKEHFELIKKEVPYLGMIAASIFVIMLIAFYKSGIAVAARTAASFMAIFVVPGYCIMVNWSKSVGFLERTLAGCIIAAGITGLFSYYFGLLGLNIKYHMFVLPVLISAFGLFFFLKE